MSSWQVDIGKILGDVKELQKEINAASETLRRSFATTDELIFRAAVKDPPSKKCYQAANSSAACFLDTVSNTFRPKFP